MEVIGICSEDRGVEQPSSHAQTRSIEDVVPADVRASIASAGGAFALDAATGEISMAVHGAELARFSPAPPRFAWSDPSFGTFARLLLEYTVWTRALQENRGRDTFMLRAALRGRLDGDALLAAAPGAGCRIQQKSSLRVKEYIVHHHSLGALVSVRVFRGQSHVFDVTWLGDAFSPLSFLVGLEEQLTAGSVANAAWSAGDDPAAMRVAAAASAIAIGLALDHEYTVDRARELVWHAATGRHMELLDETLGAGSGMRALQGIGVLGSGVWQSSTSVEDRDRAKASIEEYARAFVSGDDEWSVASEVATKWDQEGAGLADAVALHLTPNAEA